jgi:glycolate oxidase FAD binding subunit
VSVSAPAAAEALGAIVGREHVAGSGAELSAAAVDGVIPRWRVRPSSMDEVSRIMKLAASEGLSVVPRGSGSALGLGMPPARVDVALDLSRLTGILEYVPDDMVATVQAGVRLDVLGRELGKHGQMLALDPYGGLSRTVGGVIASGASGPRRFRYGTGRDLLLGAREMVGSCATRRPRRRPRSSASDTAASSGRLMRRTSDRIAMAALRAA